jgi:hypothetical protein
MQLSRFQHTGTVRYRTAAHMQPLPYIYKAAMQSTVTDPTDHNLVTIAMLRCCRLCCSAGNETGSGGGDTGSDSGDTGTGTTSGPGFDTGGAGGNGSGSIQPFEGPQTRGGFGPGFSRLESI